MENIKDNAAFEFLPLTFTTMLSHNKILEILVASMELVSRARLDWREEEEGGEKFSSLLLFPPAQSTRLAHESRLFTGLVIPEVHCVQLIALNLPVLDRQASFFLSTTRQV